MQQYGFLDDYSEGCHPNILEALTKSNMVQQTAYGFDEYSVHAKELIKNRINNSNTQIFFVTGGTQANLIITASFLRSHEAVISAHTGHILGREAGALEATGHKVISVPSKNGKLNVDLIQRALDNHAFAPHMVKPKMVYISNATEIGTVYTKNEIKTISSFCKKNNLYLFLDGARLGTALCSIYSDITLEDLGILTDVFTLGATKNGALLGEAIVINDASIAQDFNINIKQRGALLAKGRTLGIQFLELFRDDLYFDLAKRANRLARKLSDALIQKGYKLKDDTQSNQVFPILPNSIITKLEAHFSFYPWEKVDDLHTSVRLVTSWTTDESKVDEFISLL